MKILKLREEINNNNLDAIILTSRYQKGYLCNLYSNSGLVIISKSNGIILVDGRYYEDMKSNNGNLELKKIKDKNDKYTQIQKFISENNIKKIGIEENISAIEYLEFQAFLDADIEIIELVNLRLIKTEEEIFKIKKAIYIGDCVLEYIKKFISVGKTEKEIASKINCLMYELGADKPAFDTIVLSGKRSALPHGKPSDKKLESGDLVVLDFGVELDHYTSDMSRTFMMGKEASNEMKKIYEIVKEAQKKTIEVIKSNISVCELDNIARSYIESKGYGEFYIHNTGHGVGLEVHEYPDIKKDSKVKLKKGMIITIEPGIYMKNLGGVRIEDDVLVLENGYEILTKSSKNWIEL